MASQELLSLVGAFSLLCVTIFLCWVLFEIGKLVHQANEMVKDTREKMGRLERAVLAIGEKMSNVSHYLGFIAEGGKQMLSFFRTREEKASKAPKKGKEGKEVKGEEEKEVELSEMPE